MAGADKDAEGVEGEIVGDEAGTVAGLAGAMEFGAEQCGE